MEGSQQTGLMQHVYRLKWWAQAWYLTLGLLFGGLGALGIWAAVVSADWRSLSDWGTFLVCVGLATIGVFFLALALHSRVVLDGTRISARYTLREKSADLREIEGYRISVTRNATFWRLELKESSSHISIMRSFRVDDDFRAFLSQLKNLDDDGDLVSLHHRRRR